jgi:hypothetical protein
MRLFVSSTLRPEDATGSRSGPIVRDTTLERCLALLALYIGVSRVFRLLRVYVIAAEGDKSARMLQEAQIPEGGGVSLPSSSLKLNGIVSLRLTRQTQANNRWSRKASDTFSCALANPLRRDAHVGVTNSSTSDSGPNHTPRQFPKSRIPGRLDWPGLHIETLP